MKHDVKRDLRKLKRHEVLQLLLNQSEEFAQVKEELGETREQLEQMTEGYERLRKRLDQKDKTIGELRALLERERTERRIQLEEAGNIAEAALRINRVFEAAQEAADQYLYNIRLCQEGGSAPAREAGTPEEEA